MAYPPFSNFVQPPPCIVAECVISPNILMRHFVQWYYGPKLVAFGTLVPAVPCCVLCNKAWRFDTYDMVSDSNLIWYHTERQTQTRHEDQQADRRINIY